MGGAAAIRAQGGEQDSSTQTASRGSAALAIAIAAPLSIVAADIFHSWWCGIAAISDDEYGPLPVRVAMMLHGFPLYSDFRHAPHVALLYGPIVPAIVAALCRQIGVEAPGSLVVGRTFTIGSTIAAAFLIFLLARRCGGVSRGAAAVATIAFLVSPMVETWGVAFRVDMPALVCELSGLYLFATGFQYPAVGAFVASFAVKQFRFAGIAAVAMYCWLGGERRRALKLFGLWLAGIVLLNLGLGVLFPYYWMNAFTALAPLYDFTAPFAFLRDVAGSSPGLLVLAGVALPGRSSYRSLAICLLLAGLAQDCFFSLHWGSGTYYFMATLAAETMLAAEGLDRMLAETIQRGAVYRAGFALAVVVGLCASWLFREGGLRHFYRAATNGIACSEPRFSWNPAAIDRMRSIRGTVITDITDLAVENPSGNVEFFDLMSLDNVHYHGIFDDRPLIASIESRQVGGFALDAQLIDRSYRGRKFFWPELGAAIARNYALVRDPSGRPIGPPFILVPKAAR